MAPPAPDPDPDLDHDPAPGLGDGPDRGRMTPARVWSLVRDPVPGRLGYAVRMAAACTVTVLLGEIWQVPDLAVAALVTMALWQKDRVSNLIVAVVVNLIMLVVLALIYATMRLTLDHPAGIVAGVAVLSFGFFFLGSASKLKPVSYVLGLMTVYGLISIDQLPVGEIITRALLYTDLFIALPGLVMVVLGLLICPSPKTVLTDAIAARLRMAAALLRPGAQPGAQPGARSDAATRERARDMLREGARGMMGSLGMAAKERIWSRTDLACLKAAANAAVGVLALALAEAEAAARADTAPAAPQTLIATIEEMAAIFGRGHYPVEIARPPVPPDMPVLARMADLLAVFATPAPEPVPGPGQEPAPGRARETKGGGFFLPDAFGNPEHVRYAVKGTASVMVCYFLFKILDWPGIHTCIMTCFIVAQPTMGEMIAKLRLRIGGAVIGGALGIASIIVMMPHLNDVASFLALVFAGALAAAWVKTGDARIAYAGFQIGLAFFLSDIKGYGPTTDMTTARDRIVGIMLGNIVSYVVFTAIWPASARDRIAGALGRVRRALAAQREDAPIQARLAHAAEAQAAISAGERMLEFAAAEPAHVRAATAAIARYRGALDDAAALSGDMLAGTTDARADARLERLERIAS
ncbi:FUSC family protein [Nguyenibacter vanlangensis]|uniref:FUSC family protein n=1 Tax=Nguyenibacter vanlangensis TaxID=1216886 RepID=A0ABZ3D8N1_9PROT